MPASPFLRYGLALSAVTSFALAAACGDDDDDDTGHGYDDAGERAAMDSGEDPERTDAAETDGGELTATECVDLVGPLAASAGVASPECVECLCQADPQTTTACTSDCWQLNACLVDNCYRDPMFDSCAASMCGQYLGTEAARLTMAVGTGPYPSCSDLCPPGSLEAEADAGH